MKKLESVPVVSGSFRNTARALLATALLQACSAGVSGTPAVDSGMPADTAADTATDTPEETAVPAEIELYAVTHSSEPVVTVGQIVGIYARVRDGNSPLFNQSVRLSIGGGDGNLDSVSDGGYAANQGHKSVTMDHVCVDTRGDTVNTSTTLMRAPQNGGNFGRVFVQAEPCTTNNTTDTGFLVSRFYAPLGEQTAILTARVLSLPHNPSAEITIQTRTSPTIDILGGHEITAMPINNIVPHGQPFAVMVTALDGTTPITCHIDGLPVSTNGESAEESGCNETMNGPREDLWRGNNGKNIGNYGSAWTINANHPSATNIRFLARGQGNTDATPLTMTNLGGGMHLVTAQASQPGTASFHVTFSDGMSRNALANVEVRAE